MPAHKISHKYSVRPQSVRRVCERLEVEYGSPRLGNPVDPVDDLIYIMLSNRSRPEIASRIYEVLKATFPSWDLMAKVPTKRLIRLIKSAGLAKTRANHLQRAVEKIIQDFGDCTLEPLRAGTAREAEQYLKSLPGVSEKVAKCVMMYTLGFEVLPVDVHVYRISSRLGWTSAPTATQSHTELEKLIPANRRYSFHVCCIEHGRRVCAAKPKCQGCALKRQCRFYRAQSAR
jgi:endonuclease III